MATFTVRQGNRYRATISLGVFEQFASNEMIAQKLRDAGFSEVHVRGSGSKREAEALWPLAEATAEMPSQIESISEMSA